MEQSLRRNLRLIRRLHFDVGVLHLMVPQRRVRLRGRDVILVRNPTLIPQPERVDDVLAGGVVMAGHEPQTKRERCEEIQRVDHGRSMCRKRQSEGTGVAIEDDEGGAVAVGEAGVEGKAE